MTDSKVRLKGIAARAAAELTVIILGVTIALWADNWAAQRSQRSAEVARLQALSENIDQTLESLLGEKRDSESAVDVLREMAVRSSARGWTSAEVGQALLRGFFYVSVFRPELSVYDDLKNSGELSLLRDPELRRSLSALDSRMEQLRLQQDDMITVQQLNFDSYLIRRVDLRPILGPYLRLETASGLELDDLSFLNEPEFRNLVMFKLDLAEQMVQEFTRVEEALNAVNRSINAQLQP